MSLSFPRMPASISRGRFTTHDSGKFIADVEASLLKKNSRVSKHARRLYGTLRALADGKTGELRICGRWLKATIFDKAAEMCKRVRLSAMRELIAEGYVAMERPLIRREIAGRSRAVLGACQYRVLKVPKPKTDQNSKDSSRVHLLGCISCTVQEMHQQVLSTTPSEVPGSVLSSDGKNSVREHTSSSSKAPATLDDDDSRIRESHSNDGRRDLIPEIPSPNVNSRPAAKEEPTGAAPAREAKPRPPKIHPALYAWMRTRILERAPVEPDNPRAYVRAAQEEFLDPRMLTLEIEEYLADKAEEFCIEREQKSPDGKVAVEFSEQFALFDQVVQRHQLPLAGVSYDRAAREATRRLGWTVINPIAKEVEQPTSEDNANPAVNRQNKSGLTRRAPRDYRRCLRCGKTERWHKCTPEAGHDFDPEPPPPNFCALCRRTNSWHARSLEKKLRDEPNYDGHEFEAEQGDD